MNDLNVLYAIFLVYPLVALILYFESYITHEKFFFRKINYFIRISKLSKNFFLKYFVNSIIHILLMNLVLYSIQEELSLKMLITQFCILQIVSLLHSNLKNKQEKTKFEILSFFLFNLLYWSLITFTYKLTNVGNIDLIKVGLNMSVLFLYFIILNDQAKKGFLYAQSIYETLNKNLYLILNAYIGLLYILNMWEVNYLRVNLFILCAMGYAVVYLGIRFRFVK